MTNSSTQELQQFITDNKLRRNDDLILFESTISFSKAKEDFYSEVLVVSLPNEMVLYIMEFCAPGHPENEMYRCTEYQFTCLPEKKLEIADLKNGNKIIVSLGMPVAIY